MSTADQIVLGPRDEFLVVDALRYACGRGPGILDYTCRWITQHWHKLSANGRSVIARGVALEVELRRDEPPEETARHRVETPNWEKLLDHAEQELEK